MSKFIKLLTKEVATELLAGGRIIDHYLPDKKDSAEYILIEYAHPKKEKNDNREFYYGQYNVLNNKFYLGIQYVNMRKKAVKERAWDKKV